jgi:hypothetical protein
MCHALASVDMPIVAMREIHAGHPVWLYSLDDSPATIARVREHLHVPPIPNVRIDDWTGVVADMNEENYC